MVFVISAAGAATILVRKMPSARRMAVTSVELNAANFTQAARGWCVARLKRVPYFRDFNWVEFLQKMLMRGRVLVLRAENKINDYMLKLRQKAEAEKQKEGQVLDNYWHDLKTIVKTKKLDSRHATHEIEAAATGVETEFGIKSTQPLAAQTPDSALEIMVDASAATVSRVVMPEDTVSANQAQSHKKKRSAKKRKLKDPFQW